MSESRRDAGGDNIIAESREEAANGMPPSHEFRHARAAHSGATSNYIASMPISDLPAQD